MRVFVGDGWLCRRGSPDFGRGRGGQFRVVVSWSGVRTAGSSLDTERRAPANLAGEVLFCGGPAARRPVLEPTPSPERPPVTAVRQKRILGGVACGRRRIGGHVGAAARGEMATTINDCELVLSLLVSPRGGSIMGGYRFLGLAPQAVLLSPLTRLFPCPALPDGSTVSWIPSTLRALLLNAGGKSDCLGASRSSCPAKELVESGTTSRHRPLADARGSRTAPRTSCQRLLGR